MASAIPQRKCVVCRQMYPRSQLVRLAAPIRGGRIIPNPQGKTGGKGYYICRNMNCVSKLRTDRKMRKVFAPRIDDETYDWLTQLAQETAATVASSAPPMPANQ
ncbi:MAG: YlxR family protein [bacterium]|nr:YlxR family protein [bacterium]